MKVNINKRDFMKRYKALVEKVDKGEISIRDACYEMAGGMAISVLREDIKLEQIMREAGELGEPAGKVRGSENKQWERIKNQIQNL